MSFQPIGYDSNIGPVTAQNVGFGYAQRQMVLVQHPEVEDRLVLGEIESKGMNGSFEVVMHGLANGGPSVPIKLIGRHDMMPATLRDITREACRHLECRGQHMDLPYRVDPAGRIIAVDDWPR